MMSFAPANAEVVPDPATIAPDTINLTQTTESTHSANYIILYDIDKTVSPWTFEKVYYDITLKKTAYGTGLPETPYPAKAPYADVEITAKGSSDGRNPGSPLNVLIHGETAGQGGAISINSITISSITGNFIGNSATTDNGGAIWSGNSTIGNITGDFVGNTAYKSGGAIYKELGTISSITGNFIGNSATTGNGGAFFNMGSNTITSITGNFIGNSAGNGGAIYNNGGTITSITGDFIGNSANYAGAIHTSGTITTLMGNFIGNSATNGDAGAILNNGTITTLTGDFVSNTASKLGGAISNGGVITTLTSNFIGNSANNGGGAILNNQVMTIVDSNFISNNTMSSQGGAIKNNSSSSALNIISKDYDVLFSDNMANGESNAIYNIGKINLNSYKNIVFDDGIDGSNGTLNINKSTKFEAEYVTFPYPHYVLVEVEVPDVYTGTVTLNDTVTNNAINLYNGTLHFAKTDNVIDGLTFATYGGTLNTINNSVGTVALNTLDLQSDFNMAVDVDLAAEKMDRITADNYASYTGSINVVGMNLISDAAAESTQILFADDNLKANVVNQVTSTIGEGESNPYQTTAFAPIYKYDATYNPEDGFYTFARSGGGGGGGGEFNPAVLDQPAIQSANVMAVQNIVNNYAFHSVDTTSLANSHGRLSSRYLNRYAIAEEPIKDDLNTNNPLFIEPEHEGVWFKPFVSFGNTPLRNGPNVRSTSYGALIGYDSKIFNHKHGWDGVWTGYVGYTGASSHYSGVDDISNGGLMGATYSLYKGGFFNATTLTAGAMHDQATTMYGKDNMTTLYAGVGNKTGYNWGFKDGLFVLQPSVLLSYTFANTFDYTNAAGVRIDSDPLHTIQISPGIKFFMNTKNGWQPYIGVNMMWNIMGNTHTKANGVKLPEMSVKPYVQYGIGLQKVVKDHFTAYGQAMIQNGGRNGISLTFGFKWCIGRDKYKHHEKVQTNGVRTVLK